MRVVLDTNIVVAAVRSQKGASAELLQLLASGEFQIAISAPLVFEYEEILVRDLVPAFISLDDVDELIRFICAVGDKYQPEARLRPALPDADDDFLLELAVAAAVKYIITYNAGDFSGAAAFGVSTLRPAEFLELLRGKP